MTVNLTFSETVGGVSLADTVDKGQVSPGDTVPYQDIFISHDATVSSITDVSLYITRDVSTSYPGVDADADLTEILGWGDAATGGFQVVMDGWGIWTSGENTSGTWLTFTNGYGDVDNQIPLDLNSIVVGTPPGSDGIIPVGATAHIQARVAVPSSVPAGANYRGVNLVVAYSATS